MHLSPILLHMKQAQEVRILNRIYLFAARPPQPVKAYTQTKAPKAENTVWLYCSRYIIILSSAFTTYFIYCFIPQSPLNVVSS